MKNFIILIFTIGLFSTSTNGQLNLGLKFGVHSLDLASEGIIIQDPESNNLNLNVTDVKYGYNFGLVIRMTIEQIYLETGLNLNSNSVDYTLTNTGFGNVTNAFNEKYNHIDIPILLGYDWGLLRFGGGPVGHFNINSTTDLIDFPSYKQKFKDMTFGWQAGLGIDIWKFGFNLAYEGNFSNFGNSFEIGDREFELDSDPSRYIFTVEYRL